MQLLGLVRLSKMYDVGLCRFRSNSCLSIKNLSISEPILLKRICIYPVIEFQIFKRHLWQRVRGLILYFRFKYCMIGFKTKRCMQSTHPPAAARLPAARLPARPPARPPTNQPMFTWTHIGLHSVQPDRYAISRWAGGPTDGRTSGQGRWIVFIIEQNRIESYTQRFIFEFQYTNLWELEGHRFGLNIFLFNYILSETFAFRLFLNIL